MIVWQLVVSQTSISDVFMSLVGALAELVAPQTATKQMTTSTIYCVCLKLVLYSNGKVLYDFGDGQHHLAQELALM